MPVPSLPTVLCIVGARPNFMKIAPIMRALGASPRLNGLLMEAGLHRYDRTMPEENNRMLTGQISDFLFTTVKDADSSLIPTYSGGCLKSVD